MYFILIHYLIIHLIVVEWSQWSACSVTCGRGVRQRSKQCREGYRPPVEHQGTEEESCSAPQACLKGTMDKKPFGSLSALP